MHWDVKTLQDSENQQGLFQFLNTLGASSIQWLIHQCSQVIMEHFSVLLQFYAASRSVCSVWFDPAEGTAVLPGAHVASTFR